MSRICPCYVRAQGGGSMAFDGDKPAVKALLNRMDLPEQVRNIR